MYPSRGSSTRPKDNFSIPSRVELMGGGVFPVMNMDKSSMPLVDFFFKCSLNLKYINTCKTHNALVREVTIQTQLATSSS